MREFQEKRKFKKIIYSRISLAVLLIALFFVLKAVWNIYGKEQESAVLKLQSESRLADLDAQRASLAEQNSELSTPDGIEDQIRQNYHMVKQGEKLAVIIGAPTSTPSTASAALGWESIFHDIWHTIADIF